MSGRGRPNKRVEVLRAARAMFLAEGFERTSMDEVAVRAGVSKPTIYAHFETKEALLQAVVEAEAERAVERPSFELTGDPPVDLERIASTLIAMATSAESLAWDRVMAGEARRRPELGRLFFDQGPRRVITALIEVFRMFHRRGDLVVPDAEQAADLFFSLTLGMPLLRAQLTGTVPSRADQTKRARAVASVIANAYGPKKPRKRDQ